MRLIRKALEMNRSAGTVQLREMLNAFEHIREILRYQES